jgi:hypothetical protein
MQRRCFCGCGEDVGTDGWFAPGHDALAVAALRAVEELRLPHQLMSLGFGPERSVVQTAIEEAGWVRCPGCLYIGPPAAHTCTADAPAGDQPPAAASLATAGAARGRLVLGADDPGWETVPLYLRQELRGHAQLLVSPTRGPLAARENRRLLSAVKAAARMQLTGAHWTLLLTTGREAFGGPRSQRASALYAALEQVAAQHGTRAGAPTS